MPLHTNAARAEYGRGHEKRFGGNEGADAAMSQEDRRGIAIRQRRWTREQARNPHNGGGPESATGLSHD